MGGSKKRTWIGGTAFIAVVVAVATWFLLVSPNLAEASERRASAEDTRAFNDVLDLKLAKLKSDFGKLDDYKSELAAAEKKIPPSAKLETYLDGLDSIAVKRDVTITSVTAGTPETFVLPKVKEPTPAATESADGSDATDDSSDTSSSEEKDKGPKVPTGLTAVPVSVTVLGTYENTMAFLDDVHQRNARVFLVSALTGTSQKESDGSAGKPATSDGDQELVITGYIYVLPNGLAAAASEDPEGPVKLPSNPGKNPLVPVQGG
ncbi:hypothetical protein [Cellulomonas rhizosphaerae]|uniref:Pilus assembly protein PilO n=1 Tax=Cellulomonas rhizosphaerae TaxID=2293719 RepID=A0A413RL95_9CELL|nr:hypothetical protein [Cellulomonas rhizosphaerae]RHA40541.1 hypothetical protein D1825_10085 [Cellulomonas rhizosphaerae]